MVEKVDWAEVLADVGEAIEEAGQFITYRQKTEAQDPTNKSRVIKTDSETTNVRALPYDANDRLRAQGLVEEGERLLLIWAGDLSIVPSNGDEVDYDGKTNKRVLKLMEEVNPGQTAIVYIVKIES